MSNWQNEIGTSFSVRVTPKAAANRVKVEKLPSGEWQIKVYVTVPPEDGKANAAVLKLLAEELGVAPSRLEIMRGGTGRNKTIRRLD